MKPLYSPPNIFICYLSNSFSYSPTPNTLTAHTKPYYSIIPLNVFILSEEEYRKPENHKLKKQQTNTYPHSKTRTTPPAISQSRHQKTASSSLKIMIVVTRETQENFSSQSRRPQFSQVRHPKPCSLILSPPEQISQSRHPQHFPNSAPPISHIRRFPFPRFVPFCFPKS
jgi:hypothetical protein